MIPCVICVNNVIYMQLGLNSRNDILNSTLGFIFTVTHIKIFGTTSCLIIFVIILYSHDSIKDQDPEFIEKYGTLFEEFVHNKGLKKLMYYPLFFLRRTIYAFTLYNLAFIP